MEKVTVSEIEMHGTYMFSFGRLRTPREVLLRLANERAGITDNLLWHGYSYHYIPETLEHIFIKSK